MIKEHEQAEEKKICRWSISSTNPDGSMGMPHKCIAMNCPGWLDMCKYAEKKK